ncbi:MAG: hypothetical protein M3O82_09885 [Verrucomicrobiota bacterium]|nr:hypothetical protein [Verrucomicrobiota bacterium]
MRSKKSAQLRREKRRSVAARIELQEQTAIRPKKSRPDVVDKKFPIWRLPLVPVIVRRAIYAMKTNAMRGHEVKLFSEIGQGSLGMDSRDHALDAQKIGCAAEKRRVVGIEAEPLMSEVSTNVEKVAGAAAEIENT